MLVYVFTQLPSGFRANQVQLYAGNCDYNYELLRNRAAIHDQIITFLSELQYFLVVNLLIDSA